MKAYCLPKALASENMEVLRFLGGFPCSAFFFFFSPAQLLKKHSFWGRECRGPSVMVLGWRG